MTKVWSNGDLTSDANAAIGVFLGNVDLYQQLVDEIRADSFWRLNGIRPPSKRLARFEPDLMQKLNAIGVLQDWARESTSHGDLFGAWRMSMQMAFAFLQGAHVRRAQQRFAELFLGLTGEQWRPRTQGDWILVLLRANFSQLEIDEWLIWAQAPGSEYIEPHAEPQLPPNLFDPRFRGIGNLLPVEFMLIRRLVWAKNGVFRPPGIELETELALAMDHRKQRWLLNNVQWLVE